MFTIRSRVKSIIVVEKFLCPPKNRTELDHCNKIDLVPSMFKIWLIRRSWLTHFYPCPMGIIDRCAVFLEKVYYENYHLFTQTPKVFVENQETCLPVNVINMVLFFLLNLLKKVDQIWP